MKAPVSGAFFMPLFLKLTYELIVNAVIRSNPAFQAKVLLCALHGSFPVKTGEVKRKCSDGAVICVFQNQPGLIPVDQFIRVSHTCIANERNSHGHNFPLFGWGRSLFGKAGPDEKDRTVEQGNILRHMLVLHGNDPDGIGVDFQVFRFGMDD